MIKEEIENIANEPDNVENQFPEEGESEKSSLKDELSYISDTSGKILTSSGDSAEEPEAWVKSHISAAKELISNVADYFEVGKEETPEVEKDESPEELNEETLTPEQITARNAEIADLQKKLAEEKDPLKRKSIVADINAKKATLNTESNTHINEIQSDAQKAAFAKMIASKGKSKDKSSDEEPKKEVKVKKSDAGKVKEFAKELTIKGEHTKVLQMIKKLEKYVKSHIEKEV